MSTNLAFFNLNGTDGEVEFVVGLRQLVDFLIGTAVKNPDADFPALGRLDLLSGTQDDPLVLGMAKYFRGEDAYRMNLVFYPGSLKWCRRLKFSLEPGGSAEGEWGKKGSDFGVSIPAGKLRGNTLTVTNEG